MGKSLLAACLLGFAGSGLLAFVIFGPSRRLEISPSGSLRLPPDTPFAPMTPSGEVMAAHCMLVLTPKVNSNAFTVPVIPKL